MKTMKTIEIYKSPEGQKKIMESYDKNLANWPVPYELKIIKNDIAHGAAIVCGPEKAPALVLLHGSGSNSLTWLGESVLLSQHFRLVLLDIPGEPGKSQAVRYDWQGQEMMDWISIMLDELGIKECFIGGLSLGASFALKYAANHPQRVNALVLITPGGVVPVKPNLRLFWYALQGEKGFRKMMNYLFPGVDLGPEAEEFMKLTQEHFNYGFDQPPRLSDEQLASLDMPIFYYAGKKDPMVNTPKTLARLKKNIKDLRPCVFEDKGHFVMPLAKEIIQGLLNKV